MTEILNFLDKMGSGCLQKQGNHSQLLWVYYWDKFMYNAKCIKLKYIKKKHKMCVSTSTWFL